MIDTALAYLYSIPPLSAALLTTIVILWGGSIVFGCIQLLATALDREAVLYWTWLRLRYIAAWTRFHWRRWRDGTQVRVPYRVVRLVGLRRGVQNRTIGRKKVTMDLVHGRVGSALTVVL